MAQAKPMLFLVTVLLLSTIFACVTSSDTPTGTDTSSDSSTTTTSGSATTIAAAQAQNSDDGADALDYTWSEADVVDITLAGSTITVSGAGVSVAGTSALISAAGTYRISGTLTDGQVVVDAGDDDLVRLILDGATIRSTTSSPLYIANADKCILILAAGSTNAVSDGSSYAPVDSETDGPNAAVFSTCDLTLYGGGALAVTGNCNDGITSKDGLLIDGVTLTVRAVDDGIRGKDDIVVKSGQLTVTAGGNGLKADNDSDTTKGYINIAAGTLTITAGADAIAAQTDVLISDGKLTLVSGGGSTRSVSGDNSAKGIKGTTSVIVEGGTLNINSADDAVHSNGNITISGGTFAVASADDGIHADGAVTVNGGTIRITKAYEGIESRSVITFNGGDIQITASDDGVNIGGGQDASGAGGWPGQWEASGNYYLYIYGGQLVINAVGDGIDVNGQVVMTGGTVIVNGPTANMDGALDHSSFKITGGFLLAVGSSGMAQGASTTSTQYSMLVNLRSVQSAGTLVHLQTSQGNEIVTFAPAKAYQSIVFSSPALAKSYTYDLYLGGSDTGTATNGLYSDGTYTPGSKYVSLTLSSVVTTSR